MFSLLLNVRKKRCAWAALSRGVVFLKPSRHLKLKLRLMFVLFFKCHIISDVNKRQLFLRKKCIFSIFWLADEGWCYGCISLHFKTKMFFFKTNLLQRISSNLFLCQKKNILNSYHKCVLG